jgi:hypothetical protein
MWAEWPSVNSSAPEMHQTAVNVDIFDKNIGTCHVNCAKCARTEEH